MAAPPPSSAPPPGMSREVVESIRRKMAPPAGPPPAGMLKAAFSAPKKISEKDRDRDAMDENEELQRSYDDEDEYNRGGKKYGKSNSNYRDTGSSSRRAGAKDLKLDTEEDSNNFTYAPNSYKDRNQGHKGEDVQHYGEGEYDEEDEYYDEEDDGEEWVDYNRQTEENGGSPGSISPKPRPKVSRDWGDDDAQAKSSGGNNTLRSSAEGRPMSAAATEVKQQQGVNAALATLRNTNVGGNTASVPGRLVLYNFQKILTATYRELKNFVTSPCPPGVTIRCYIERNRSGTKMLAPFYSICADLEDGTGRELMVCRKIIRSRSPHYVFSLKTDDLWRKREQRSRLFLGKLRATSNNEYVMYDNGICAAPEDTVVEDEDAAPTVGDGRKGTVLAKKFERDMKGSTTSSEDVSLYRKELAIIHYNVKNRPCQTGVRGMEVCIPNTFGAGSAAADGALPTATEGKPSPQIFNIEKPFEKIRAAGKQNEMFGKSCFILHERNSRYDPLSSCLVDFKGRANVASVKNCQLIESSPALSTGGAIPKPDQEKEFKLQLGKTTEDCFNMDFRHPLSLLQAFAISISRFDANLSW